MSPPRPSSHLEQTARLLRDGIIARRWAGTLPGVLPLAKELGTSTATLHRALKQLEQEGLIEPMGAGRRRQVCIQALPEVTRPAQRVGLLLPDNLPALADNVRLFLHDLMHALESVGHVPFIATQSMHALHHKPQAIRTLMESSAADLWIVYGADYPVIENLAVGFPKPVMAMGGRHIGLEIAASGIEIISTIRETTTRLIDQGHERIVLVLPPVHRKPQPGAIVHAFLESLSAAGITAGSYHVPDWEYSAAGYEKLLHSLFALTPPTALILMDARLYVATLSFFAVHGISPEQTSLMICENNSTLDWVHPRPGYMVHEDELMILDVMNWIEAQLAGSIDRPQHLHPARLVPGDTFNSPSRKDADKR